MEVRVEHIAGLQFECAVRGHRIFERSAAGTGAQTRE